MFSIASSGELSPHHSQAHPAPDHTTRLATSADLSQVALEYWQHGINVVPCAETTKTPTSTWKHYQERRQTEDEVGALFRDQTGNIAVVCGPASENLCAIDIEDRGQFQEWDAEFQRLFGPTWTVSTHRGGHIYFKTRQPIVGHTYHDQRFEIRGSNQIVMAPPSTHPEGSRYEFLSKPSSIAVVNYLPFCQLDFVHPEAPVTPAATRIIRLVSQEECQEVFNRISLRRDRSPDRYPSRSEYDQAIIMSLVNKGADFGCVLAAFETAKEDTHFAKLANQGKRRDAESYLLRSFKKALRRWAFSPSPSHDDLTQEQARRLRQYVNDLRWSLRSLDKPVLLAHITQFERCMAQPWPLSVRNGAEIACVAGSTISQSNQRLIRAGYLRQVSRSWWEKPATFEFGAVLQDVLSNTQKFPGATEYSRMWEPGDLQENIEQEENRKPENNQENIQQGNNQRNHPRTNQGNTEEKQDTRIDSYNSTDCIGQTNTHGVFERQGLGRAAEAIWLATREGWIKQTEIVSRTGLVKGTVSKGIKKLCEHGILVQQGKTYRAVSDYDFKTLAKTLGTYNVAAERQRVHRQEREDYRAEQQEKRGKYNYEYKREIYNRPMPRMGQRNQTNRSGTDIKEITGVHRVDGGAGFIAEHIPEYPWHDIALDYLNSPCTTWAEWEAHRVGATGDPGTWIAGCSSPRLRELHDLAEAACRDEIARLQVPETPGNPCGFILDSIIEIRMLIVTPREFQHIEAAEKRYEHLVSTLESIRNRWKAHPNPGELHLFARTSQDDTPNPIVVQMDAAEAQAKRITEMLRCANPACKCHQPDSLVHCPGCGRLSLRAKMGADLQVVVYCRRLSYQRQQACIRSDLHEILDDWGVWDASLSDTAAAAWGHTDAGLKEGVK